jgi:hypothetical protein
MATEVLYGGTRFIAPSTLGRPVATGGYPRTISARPLRRDGGEKAAVFRGF